MQRDERPESAAAPSSHLGPFVWSSRVVLVLAIAAQSLVGVLIIAVALFLFVRPWSRSLYRRLCCKWCGSAWIEAMSLFLPRLCLTINGDSDMLDGIGSGVIIVNHQTEIDWWAIYMVARFVGLHGNIKVIVKESLKRFPLLGWFLQLLEFPFLGKSWVDYRAALISQFRSFAQEDFPTLYLIFPEGNQKDAKSILKSQEFAEREGRPRLQHLLLPHTTGFNACLDALRESFPVVYDATLAFAHLRKGQVQPEGRNFWSGLSHFVSLDATYEVHVHIKRFSVEEVVRDAHWLDERWGIKDQLLQNFEVFGSLTSSPNPSPGGHQGAGGFDQSPRAQNKNGLSGISWNPNVVPVGAPGDSSRVGSNGNSNGHNGHNGHALGPGIRRGDSRAYNQEAAVLSLARLCALPLVLPIIIFFSLPITVTCVTGYVLHKVFSVITGVGERRNRYKKRLGGPSPGPSRSRTPWVPHTPFTSPLGRVFERANSLNSLQEMEDSTLMPARMQISTEVTSEPRRRT